MVMTLPKGTVVKIMLLAIAATFVWFGTFGLLYHMNSMQMDGHKGGCLFDGPAEICAMNYSEHIASWQNMFTSLPQNANLINLLVLTMLSFVLLFSGRNLFKLFESIASRWRYRASKPVQENIFNSLREAFSQGILNPKIYYRAS